MPLVRHPVRTAVVPAASEHQRADRSLRPLRQPALRLLPEAPPAHRGGGRADLPPPARVHDRDRRQVRGVAVDRRDGAFLPRRRPGPPEAARPDHPGRAAPHFRAARHHGRSLRDGDRSPVHAAHRRRDRAPEGDCLHRDRASGAKADPGPVQPAGGRCVPGPGARPARLLLRPAGIGERGGRTPVSRRGRAGPGAEGRVSAQHDHADGGGPGGVGGGRRGRVRVCGRDRDRGRIQDRSQVRSQIRGRSRVRVLRPEPRPWPEPGPGSEPSPRPVPQPDPGPGPRPDPTPGPRPRPDSASEPLPTPPIRT